MLPSKYELRPFFSFMVDDMIFFRDLNLHMCMLTLEESVTSYAIHLKLSPNICYSHTNNKLITLPKFEPAEAIKANSQTEVAQVISQHSSYSNRSGFNDDDNNMGGGLFSNHMAQSDNNGGQAQQQASSMMTRMSHGSSLSGYVERETQSNTQ